MPKDSVRIRVLIVDDHQLFRQGLRALLMTAKDIEVVGEARDGMEAIKAAERLKPDIVLMDIQLPYLDGLAATRQLTAAGCGSRVLLLSMREDEEAVWQAAQAGAWGYQIKNSDRDELVGAVRSIHQGIRVASPPISRVFFEAIDRENRRKQTRPNARSENE